MRQKPFWIAFWVYFAAIVLAAATSTANPTSKGAGPTTSRVQPRVSN